MAKEIEFLDGVAGMTYLAVVRNTAGLTWTGTAGNFAAMSSITIADAALSVDPDATVTNWFTIDFPTGIAAGRYTVAIFEQEGEDPEMTDLANPPVGVVENFDWNGTGVVAPGVGSTLTTAERLAIADAIADEEYETNFTLRKIVRGMAATLLGKTADGNTFRDLNDTKDRIVATTTDAGARTAITRDLT